MDVHKDTVVVRVLPPDGEEGQPVKKVYGGLRHVPQRSGPDAGMAEGVYWHPIWNVREVYHW